MPHEGPIYGVARIRVLEKGLIGKNRMQRLLEASAEEAIRLLSEMGYGGSREAGAGNVEEMIGSELSRTRAVIDEVTPDKALTDLFFLKYDIGALKLFLKLRLVKGTRPIPLVKGVYETERLASAVDKKEYSFLPEEIKEALLALEKSFETEANPGRISTELDKAYFLHVRRALEDTNYGDTKRYYSELADFDNVLSMLRMGRMRASEGEFASMLLPGGVLSEELLKKAFGLPIDEALKLLDTEGAPKSILKGISEVIRAGRISALEKARDDRLMEIAREGKQDIDTIRPILGFLLAREQEAKCIRLIVTAKRNGLGDQVITERLRELYG
jgi:V/A-type H+-transporting ATPase subunit C